MSDELKRPFRPSWDDYFMSLVRILATRSSCDRLHAGAILVKDKRIISSGYNGAPPGLPTCDEIGHLMEEGHCVRTIHGEHNAILQATQLGGISTRGCTMYTKYNPCIHCAKYVVAAGIERVVIGKIYRGSEALNYLREAGLTVDIYENNAQWGDYLSKIFLQDMPEVKAKEGDVILKKEA
jgi:dCMP deaminase